MPNKETKKTVAHQEKEPAPKKRAAKEPVPVKKVAEAVKEAVVPVTKKAAQSVKKAAATVEKAAKKPAAKAARPADPALDSHLYFFHEGTDSRAYEFLGSHLTARDGKAGVVFRVWAPDARSVAVMGDFCSWDPAAHPMEKISVGVWELFIPGLKVFDSYKYAIVTRDNRRLEKADPYAFHAEVRPKTASKVYDLEGFDWHDEGWVSARASAYDRPMNIYEMHLGSWRRGVDDRLLSYDEIGDLLIPYVKEMGYTHVELMPVMEHPYDLSWGYQVTGYFAATSRFGTPHDLMRLIDRLHGAGVGVILDWVPAHFPKDGHGLVEFDGTYCYEYGDPLKMEHADWGTRVFDYGRNETRSFLMSSALFWLDKFHADGLRVDAVASMLYLDYGKKNNGGWRPNIHGGRENLEAVDFLRRLNEAVFADYPHTLMMAEESTAWPMVTKPTYMGGLGFNFKWNMGWMNDTLSYVKLDPIFRQYNHNNLTFSMMYAFSENFVLPVSHDEVVHGKCSLIAKMPGYYDDKFAGVRVFLSYMMSHPGKKLHFMGNEFGHFSEWDCQRSLDWHLLDYAAHANLKEFVKRLNHFYLENACLWQVDTDWHGFEWLNAGDYQGNTLAYRRIDQNGGDIVAVMNFSPLCKEGFRLGLSEPGVYVEALNSDAVEFGGWGHINPYEMPTGDEPANGKPHSLMLTLPPYGAVFLKKRV